MMLATLWKKKKEKDLAVVWSCRPVFSLPHNTAKTEGLKQSKADLFNPAATLELLLLVICLSFASVQMAGAHWLVDAVNLSGT